VSYLLVAQGTPYVAGAGLYDEKAKIRDLDRLAGGRQWPWARGAGGDFGQSRFSDGRGGQGLESDLVWPELSRATLL
jgi:hypothetical protein